MSRVFPFSVGPAVFGWVQTSLRHMATGPLTAQALPFAIVACGVEFLVMLALDSDLWVSPAAESALDATALAVISGLAAVVLFARIDGPKHSRRKALILAGLLFATEILCHSLLLPLRSAVADIVIDTVNAVAVGVIAWAGALWLLWSSRLAAAAETLETEARPDRYAALAMYLILGAVSIFVALIVVSETWRRDQEAGSADLVNIAGRQRSLSQQFVRLDILRRIDPDRRSDYDAKLGATHRLLTMDGIEVEAHVRMRAANWGSAGHGILRHLPTINRLRGELVAEVGVDEGAQLHEILRHREQTGELFRHEIEAFVAELTRVVEAQNRRSFDEAILKAIAIYIALALLAFAVVRPIVAEIRRQGQRERSARREVEDSLARLRSYQAALDNHFIIAATDLTGRIVEVNDQFCRISGYEREELIGRTHRLINSGEHPEGFFKDLWATIRAGKTWTGEICNRAKNGSLYWVRSIVFPVMDAGGRIERYVAIRTDITETKRAHRLLEEAVEAVPDGFVIYDWTDRLIICNSAYRNLYAQSASVIRPGMRFEDILRYGATVGQYPEAGDTVESRERWIAERLRAHLEQKRDIRQQLPNGRWLQIRERTTASGYRVGFRTDVTDIQRQAATLDTIISNFPGGIAVIDPSERVTTTNENYRRLLGYPDELFAGSGPTLEDIFKFNALRGEYGPGDRQTIVEDRLRTARAGTRHTYVRRRPNGIVVEVHGAPIPGGGFVTVCLDVTERHRKDEALAEALAKLEAFVEHAPAAVAMFDREMRYMAASQRWLVDYGLEGRPLLGRSHYEVFPNISERWKEIHRRCLAGAVERCDDEVFERPDGSRINLRWEVRPWCHADGQIGGVVTLTEDISERKAAEAAVRASEEQFRSLFQLAPVGVAVTEAESGMFRLVSDSLVELTGYSADELNGRSLGSLFAADQRLASGLVGAPEGGKFGPFEIDCMHRDGKRVPTMVSGVNVHDSDGRALRLMILQDISERRQTEQRLWRLANLDSLTGLANRLLFNERLETTLRSAGRGDGHFAVGLIDLDKFKEINDTYGHDQGDVLLKTVADRMSSVFRESDTLARLGGDEFAFILGGVGQVSELRRPLEKLIAAMDEPVMIGGAPRRCGMSIGVTVFPTDARSAVELLKNADIALYRAKGGGRGRVEFFQPDMRVAVERRNLLKAEVEAGLARDEFDVFYQPIVTLPEGHLVGVEALLRWRHPRLGLIGPDAFKDVFEEPKLAAAIGDRVMSLVADHVARWSRRQAEVPQVALNVTAADFATGTYVDRLMAQIRRHGLAPQQFCLEITEGMFLGRGADTTQDVMQSLSAAGFELALDDFGTGYASLSHLRQFPVDRLKIDRSFVADMEHDPGDAAIVRAISHLAESLGLGVTAEGVDSHGQLQLLHLVGVDRIQGYLISKPLPIAQMETFGNGAPMRESMLQSIRSG